MNRWFGRPLLMLIDPVGECHGDFSPIIYRPSLEFQSEPPDEQIAGSPGERIKLRVPILPWEERPRSRMKA
jgi:hypothetical protein